MMHRYLNDLSVTLSEWVNTLIIFSIAIIFYVSIIVYESRSLAINLIITDRLEFYFKTQTRKKTLKWTID